jgi:hypothetical protein
MAVKKKDLPEISPKSTKEQILSAYNEIVERLQENQMESPQTEKKKSDEKEIISKSSQASLEGIVSHLAGLKITLTKNIDTLSESLVTEFDKLTELKRAITLEQCHLQELYDIKETAHTLSALMLLQKEETEKFELKMKEDRAQFEKEMDEKKTLWSKKQVDLELNYTELKEKLEKQHKREEEEYKYNLEVSRRQEQQDYLLKKELLEKELEQKRAELDQKEASLESHLQEIEKLKEKVEQFPAELAKETEKTAQEIAQRLEAQHQFAETLKEKEIEGERNLALQKIASLEAKVKEQAVSIAQLTQKANESIQQVQTIACKALEASSSRLSPLPYGDKGQEITQSHRQDKVA